MGVRGREACASVAAADPHQARSLARSTSPLRGEVKWCRVADLGTPRYTAPNRRQIHGRHAGGDRRRRRAHGAHADPGHRRDQGLGAGRRRRRAGLRRDRPRCRRVGRSRPERHQGDERRRAAPQSRRRLDRVHHSGRHAGVRGADGRCGPRARHRHHRPFRRRGSGDRQGGQAARPSSSPAI